MMQYNKRRFLIVISGKKMPEKDDLTIKYDGTVLNI